MKCPKTKLALAHLVAFCVWLAASAVSADTIIVPSQFANTEAGSSDNAPLGAAEQRFQQVFSSTLLTNLSVGDLINGLAFRVEGNQTALPAQTISTYDISLSQSPNAPGSLGLTFASNRGPDFQMVRSGPLSINAGDFPGGSSPNNLGWISFSAPYQYKGGDLLIEVAFHGFSLGRDADAAYPYTAGLAQTAFGTGFSSTTADAGIYNEALVIGLSTVLVPEPRAVLMVGLGLSLMVHRLSRSTRLGNRPRNLNERAARQQADSCCETRQQSL